MFLNSALISEMTLQLRMAFEKLDQQLFLRFNEVNDLSKQEQQGAEEDYKTIQEKWEKDKILHKVKRAVESSRAAAKKLDDVWAKYQMAHAWGSLAGIIGGGLTIGGGIVTIMTAGVASPLLYLGLGVGMAGAGANVVTKILEVIQNSHEIKKADEDMKEALESLREAKITIQNVLDKKHESYVLYIFKLACKSANPTWKLLAPYLYTRGIIDVMAFEACEAGVHAAAQGTQAAGHASAQGAMKASGQVADDVIQAGVKSGSRMAGKVMLISVSAAMLLWDAVDLTWTIYDLVNNKGSEAAKDLRKKADELEKIYIDI